jgi:HSP20 family protein
VLEKINSVHGRGETRRGRHPNTLAPDPMKKTNPTKKHNKNTTMKSSLLPTTRSPFRGTLDPFQEMNEIQNRLSSLFGNGGFMEPALTTDWAPAVDIVEEDECFKIEADLPNVNKEDIHVSVDNGVLTLTGERSQEKETKKRRYHRTERSWGSYERSFRLPDQVDVENVDAQFKKGVLTLTIPKTGEFKSSHKTIEIHN